MELVIKIPDSLYEKALAIKGTDEELCFEDRLQLEIALENGTPLPKGHGVLKDADELTKEIKSYISDTSNLHYDDLAEAEAYNSAYYNCLDEIEDASTIIEADDVESERYEMTYENGELPNGGWISVSESLPGYGEEVLTFTKHGNIKVAFRDVLTKPLWSTGLGKPLEVIAWMPLPEPYKVESER